jgi:hypothetical protein
MHHDASRDAPSTSFINPHAKDKHGGAAKALFCRNIIDACEVREHGGDSKRTSSGRSNNASKGVDENVWKVHAVKKQQSALEKNRAKRRREVSLPSSSLFVCSSL